MPYSQEDLKLVVEEVKAGRLTTWQAYRKYNIPHSTIHGYVKGHKSRGLSFIGKGKGRPNALSKETEETIARCLNTMDKWGFALSKKHICDTVQSFVQQNNIQTPFYEGRPGWKWVRAFMKRNCLNFDFSQKVQAARGQNQIDPFVIYSFYDTLELHYATEDIWNKPESIYYLDKSLVCFDPTRTKLVYASGENVKRQVNESCKECTTVLVSVSASGHILPPHILFSGEKVEPLWLDQNLKKYPGTTVDVSDNGLLTQNAFYRWFKNIFINEVKVRPCVLIVDGRTTHVALEVIQTALEENIVILKLPTHSTHILQPIDVSFFRPFIAALEMNVSKFQPSSHANMMGEPRFLEEIGNSWYKFSASTCIAGFSKTGIYPFNRYAIQQSSFDLDALQRYNEIQIQENQSLGINDDCRQMCAADELDIEGDLPLTDSQMEVDNTVKESAVNSELPACGSVSLQFNSNDGLILNDEDFTANINSLYSKHSHTEYQNDILTTPVMCDASVQTNLTLDKNISDESMAFLQTMYHHFQRHINDNSESNQEQPVQATSRLEISPEAFASPTSESCVMKSMYLPTKNKFQPEKRKVVGSKSSEFITTEAFVKKMNEKDEDKRKKLEKQLALLKK